MDTVSSKAERFITKGNLKQNHMPFKQTREFLFLPITTGTAPLSAEAQKPRRKKGVMKSRV